MTSRGSELAVALLLVAACGVPSPPAPSPAVRRQAVLGGALEGGWPAVGAIVPVSPLCGDPIEASPVTCTGTLIAPRVVLTAAHCVENTDAPQVLSVVFAPETARALTSERVRTLGGRLHPAWSAGENDLGVLILAEDAPVAPIPLSGSLLPEDAVGRTTRVVGFGLDEQGRTGLRRGGIARITEVEAGTFSIEAAPGMSCGGDSGGPLFLEVGGTERIVGVTSFGDLACRRGTNTRLDLHASFVQAIVDEVARTPPTRPPFEPTVDTCAARCQEHAECPLGMACVPHPRGGKSCAAAGLEAGHFGAACTGNGGDVPCVKAGETCRQWLPCVEESEGGCAVASGEAGLMGLWGALLVLGVRRRHPFKGRGAVTTSPARP